MTESAYYRTDGPYRGNAPCFYDVDRLPWARAVQQSWRAIRTEYETNIRRGTDRVVDVFNPTGPKVPGWRSVNFQTYLWRFDEARRSFPTTVALLESIPGLTSAFINVLEPHSTIPSHHGDSNTIMRCHFGLDVPDGNCGVQVGSETRQCRNGALIAFSDAHEHRSWNATDERRVVLVFDIMLPAYREHTRWICANVLAAVGVVWLEAHLRVFRRGSTLELRKSGKTIPFPQPVRTALRRALAVGVYLRLLAQRGRAECEPLATDAVAAAP
jgi:hypothetical protein